MFRTRKTLAEPATLYEVPIQSAGVQNHLSYNAATRDLILQTSLILGETRKSNNTIIVMGTYMTHLTLKRFVSNSELDIRRGFTATLLSRLLENKRDEC